MKRYAAFLRGINVSGQKLIKMELLKEMMAMPGVKNVVTYIQSGNIAFDAKEADNEQLALKIEKKLHKDLGYHVPVVVRSIEELNEVIAANPFNKQEDGDKRKLYVNFLDKAPEQGAHTLLLPYATADEELAIVNKELYLLLPGAGNTKLNLSLIEKKLGVTATARNWNTVNKMITM